LEETIPYTCGASHRTRWFSPTNNKMERCPTNNNNNNQEWDNTESNALMKSKDTQKTF
jgi:hypothetical protein